MSCEYFFSNFERKSTRIKDKFAQKRWPSKIYAILIHARSWPQQLYLQSSLSLVLTKLNIYFSGFEAETLIVTMSNFCYEYYVNAIYFSAYSVSKFCV